MKKLKMYVFNVGLILFTALIITGIGNQGLKAAQQVDSTWTIINPSICAGRPLNEVINREIWPERKFYITDGVYNLTGNIQANDDNVIIQGQSKENTKLVQNNPASNSIDVTANGVQISNLNINNKLGGVAVSVQNSNNVTVDSCIIYGAQNDNAVVFIKSSKNEIQNVESGNLNMCNVLSNNDIFSSYPWDGVLFSKQNHGSVQNNIINGSRIAFYLSRNSDVTNNRIENSPTNGIRYAVPAYDNKIVGNTIENSTGSAILATRYNPSITPESYRANDVKIKNNTIIGSRYFGIEVNNLKNSDISGNNVQDADFYGIYMLSSDALSVVKNQIQDSNYLSIDGQVQHWDGRYNAGIMLDSTVTGSSMDGNTIVNSATNCPYGIRIQPNVSNNSNIIINNIVNGDFGDGISARVDAPFNNIIGDGNVVTLKSSKAQSAVTK
ncbi:right-handed parallel beta-helix repeat-containing protein [Clostridium felsineum]|uniref:right-handed parallel beta-helix repeat-containing protein n=1 Tax=Clostridium felsineum TaxID=36839 RepID=UPI00214DD1AF|nr:right-handed parallel beta-helix repeat-containing protein [Clostridium felsineum]MCR3757426.1 right-handed parallel beta-helix repeat-containing protein [Clostridium felsineum]